MQRVKESLNMYAISSSIFFKKISKTHYSRIFYIRSPRDKMVFFIKLKGMISRAGYNEKFYHRIKLVTLGGQMVKYHWVSSRVWGFEMAHHRMISSLKLSVILIIAR